MRPQIDLRAGRARVALAGALATATAAAVTTSVAPAAHAQSPPAIHVADPSIRYGQAAVVRGSVGAQNAARQVALEYGSDTRGWRVIRTAVAGRDGRYAFATRLRRTGQLRVAVPSGSALRTGEPAPPVASAARSAPRRVTVAVRIGAPWRRLDVPAGDVAAVRGTVAPWRAGRLVRLETWLRGRWRIVDSDRTDARGRYSLAHRAGFVGGRYARVTFRGDAVNARAVQRIGRVYGYRAALASRYDIYGGPLACGGRLGYHALVVAHKTLPCGTQVRVRYRGRVVTATVRDRGPYVGAREYDLAGAVARRLGFDGVGRIWVTR